MELEIGTIDLLTPRIDAPKKLTLYHVLVLHVSRLASLWSADMLDSNHKKRSVYWL